MDEEEEAEVAEVQKDPTLALFLGLYLILLAFFVLLNTMATPKQDRVKAVMGSLLSTFSTEILNKMNPTEFTASVGDSLALEEYHREVRDFFQVAIPLSRVEFFSAGTVMRVRMPADQMFERGSILLREDREDLIHRITRSLSRKVAGLSYELEFSTFTGPFLANEGATAQIIEIARAGAFARAIQERGAPAESVVIGAQPGSPGDIEMIFQVRVHSGSRVDFSE
jgi:hypothetical protein